MRFFSVAAVTAAVRLVQAVNTGFNYGAIMSDGSAKSQAEFEAEFNRAKSLQGTDGIFTSARIYTTIQAGTPNTPISAIPAAIKTKTSLLLGLWASAGPEVYANELIALKAAISQYGSAFTDLVVGISVGSEDLYRISPTGIENHSGVGIGPDVLVKYIQQLRSTVKGTALAKAPVGHVDTWTAWINGTNSAVVDALDWVGMDTYPYFQTTMENSIETANHTFFAAYDVTIHSAKGKPVWVTETGWPVSGPKENLAEASAKNAEKYWYDVACTIVGNVNTWWYTLRDAEPTTPNPSFGIVPSDLNAGPLYNLSCHHSSTSATHSQSASATHSQSASATHSKSASNTVSVAEVAKPMSIHHSTVKQGKSLTASNQGGKATAAGYGKPVDHSGSTQNAKATAEATAADHGKPAEGSNAKPTAAAPDAAGPATHMVTEVATDVTTYCPEEQTAQTAQTHASSPQAAASVKHDAPAAPAAPAPSENEAPKPPAPSGNYAPKSPAAAVQPPPAAESNGQPFYGHGGKSCPASLEGEHQIPHLIVPVSPTEPNRVCGKSYNVTINSHRNTLLNFDIPASYEGKTCSLVMLLPEHSQLQTSAYTFNNKGGITVNYLTHAVTEKVTYNSMPKDSHNGVGKVESVRAGGKWVLTSSPCKAGTTQCFELVGTGGLELEFFQDYNPSPIGVFVTAC